MNFRIADTFTASLARLNGEEQKAVKTTAFDLQMNPAQPGMSFHKLDRARDPRFWSVRVSSDIRLIVHRTDASLLLCYVDHHDKAYQWAERRKLETHPRTGAAQFVEVRERVEEVAVPYYAAPSAVAGKPALFAARSDEELLGYGVPAEWLAEVRRADEDSLLELADHLPAEAAEALLELATGGRPQPAPAGAEHADPFSHPDALRRFRVMNDVEELRRALDFPWDKWTVFLHPAQRQWVEREYNGPARVSGSAGTGKTIVALHRAVHLARRHPDSRVLLGTFSDTLATALHDKLRRLIGSEPRLAERLEVVAMDAIGERLYAVQFGRPRIAGTDAIRPLLAEAAANLPGQRFGAGFLLAEWSELVDAWQLKSWEDYRDIRRLGRKSRLSEAQRAAIWPVFEALHARIDAAGLVTRAGMFHRLAERLAQGAVPPFDFVIVDEAQDIGVAQLRFLAALGGGRPDSLFFAGDLGQRIFQPAFSWKAVGVDVRGRSRTLNINYRTSHQIRTRADRLLGPELADVDGNAEVRRGTVSVFNGPEPAIRTFATEIDECAAVAAWLCNCRAGGVAAGEIGVVVRSPAQFERARAAVEAAGCAFTVLDGRIDADADAVAIGTMHRVKGLEFRAVAVMACDDEIIPQQARIETVADPSDLEDVYNTERHLLYVACTRARDDLLMTATEPVSEFLDDLLGDGRR